MLDAVRQSPTTAAAAAAAAAAGRRITSRQRPPSTDAKRSLLGRVARQPGAAHVRLRGGRSRRRGPARQQACHHRSFYVLDETHCDQLSVLITVVHLAFTHVHTNTLRRL